MGKQKPFLSIMIVPPGGRSSWTLRLSKPIFFGIIGTFVAAIFGVGFTVLYTSQTSVERTQYKQFKQKAIQQEQAIQVLHAEVDEIKTDIQEIIEKEGEIRNLLNKKSRRSRVRKSKKNSRIFKKDYEKIVAESPVEEVQEKISFLKNTVAGLTETYLSLGRKLSEYRVRFSATPSIWPIYGRILSDFGWRYHPFKKRREFHRGIDIPSWIGAPIKATADGKVVFSGWGGGYGLTVAIDHGNGYLTMYAHGSKILIRKGDRVKKGQKIANVGSSGLSTGPHVHYEIRKWKKPVSPRPYLDLDMFTAGRKIW